MKFSIITCAYNPNETIFNRLIKAIGKLSIPEKTEIEWIVVDNNSIPELEQYFDFSNLSIPIVHKKESNPGLTNARIAGSKIATGEWLIFFDDDNEPSSDFIINLSIALDKYPTINCWGPGRIEVEYIGNVDSWFLKNKTYYQQRKEETKFGSAPFMQSYYPIGTGLCIEKKSMLNYISKVESGLYSVKDRTAKSLISGGDTQIVLNNQVIGGTAGKFKNLSLKHLIEARKANFKYLKKQQYWTASSYVLVINQVYGEKANINLEPFGIKQLLYLLKKFYNEVKVKKKDLKSAYLMVCKTLGNQNARYQSQLLKKNRLFKIVEAIIIN